VIVDIFCLCCIFNKVSVTHSVKSHIINHSKVMNTMCCNCTVIGLVNSIADNIGLVDGTDHVEVNWVATKFESLTYVFELYILNSTNTRLISRRVNHNVTSIEIYWRDNRVTSENYVSGEKTNFRLHGHFNTAI
jgi:hypothetical protein